MWHAIAVRTLQPTLRSAREYCGKVQTPGIVASGTSEECFAFIQSICSRVNCDLDEAETGLPAAIYSDWTYFIVEDKREK